jgi:hypothetical protein
MPKKFKIIHPANETVQTNTFPAFGYAPKGVAEVVGFLEDDAGKVIATSTPLESPPRWIILFKDIPAGGPYNLRVEIPDGPVLGYSWDIIVKPIFGLNILFPAPNGSMCQSNCVSYGSTTGGNPTGTMTLGGVTTPGNLVNGAPNWIIRFPATIALGNGYLLTVTSDQPPQTRNNLSVNNC